MMFLRRSVIVLFAISFGLVGCEDSFKVNSSIAQNSESGDSSSPGNNNNNGSNNQPTPAVEINSRVSSFYPKAISLDFDGRVYLYSEVQGAFDDVQSIEIQGVECDDIQPHTIDMTQALDQLNAGLALSAVSCAAPRVAQYGEEDIRLNHDNNEFSLVNQKMIVESASISVASDFAKLNRNWWGQYSVTNDIDLAMAAMVPIQNFYGSIDGGGFTVSNMNIVGSTGVTAFIISMGGTIKNLTLATPKVSQTVAANDPNAVHAVGQLVAVLLDTGVVENVAIRDGSIDVTDPNDIIVSGGVTLRAPNSTITNLIVETTQTWAVDVMSAYQLCLDGSTNAMFPPNLVTTGEPLRLTGNIGSLDNDGTYDVVGACDLDFNNLRD